MVNFILGISITLNIVFLVTLFFILKIYVIKTEKKESKDFNKEAIVDVNMVRDFWG